MRDPDELVTFNIQAQDYWWSEYVYGIRFGEENDQAYYTDEDLGFTDSGTSCLIAPEKYYDWIVDQYAEFGEIIENK